MSTPGREQAPLTPPSPGPSPGADPWPGYRAPGPGPATPDAYPIPDRYLTAHGAPAHPMAITSLVLGVVGIVGVVLAPFLLVSLVAVLASPFAIWLGISSRRQIQANPRQHSGEGLALAGLITGIVGIVLGLLMLLVVVAFIALLVALFAGTTA
ncbi:DUF4190 domain-containing protein [Nocardioides caeni]|uniref:DUF4190 domain-containing protein n=1 Tax=Nocardioides caeni TaxID=574700 RepID=A0A4S8NAV2_9ACTN|nr:DUF4190 domain-containing protein [Nocardioides caeni]THV13022.1 DUF4190 domain-containing protein [Nocardioides caeni]